ncbi:MAG: efflux RND transporter permease subunit [Proteobacteria bacterium]|nr:efflux RND transporter permease subunit [Pseudomonadota bacterium]
MVWLTRLALRAPVSAALLVLAVTLVAAGGLLRLDTDVGYRAFLGASHESIERFDAFVERFGRGLPLAVVWSCDESPGCEHALDPDSLAVAKALERALAASPVVRRSIGPASALLLEATPFGPLPARFFEDGRLVADHARLAALAPHDPLWARRLVSEDGRVAAVVAELESSSGAVARQAYAALEEAVAPFEADGFRFHRVGGPVEFVVAGGELERATAQLIPVMVGLVALALVALFRSATAAAVALVPVGLAVVWTLGALGWIGWPQNTLTQVLAPLVLVIGVCDAIHVVSRYATLGAAEPPTDRTARRRLVERAAAEVGPPCAMTTLTTAAGFLAFTGAELESFARFGVVAAIGVVAALLLCFTALPLGLLLLAPDRVPAQRASRAFERALGAVVALGRRRAVAITLAAAAVGAGAVAGMAQLRVDARFEELYGEHSRVVRWARFVGEHLRRPDTLEIELELPAAAQLADPVVLDTLQQVATRLEADPDLGRVQSLLTSLAAVERALVSQPTAPELSEAERIEGVLALARAFGPWPGEDGLADWVDASGRRVRLSVESDKTPQERLRRVLRDVEHLLAHELPAGWRGTATGPLAVVHDMIEAIRRVQLESFAWAAAAVWLLMALFLRSLAWATLALVPTVLPVVLTLGVMGLFGWALDVGSAMVAAVVLGIAVDDAIHLLSAFGRARRAGSEPAEAMAEAVGQVGRALVSTSAALVLGFSALAASPWPSIASFGGLAAITIGAALAADLLVLPALVTLWERVRPA